ncbi:hypothetical protein [Pseudorhodoferax soli]|uniref:Lipoprotein n=1 Tax=Pseudorhodoferax soli TaxID=545864 RepID=A0A368Y372_9BURK|nr:hypothetical protein [Pseudorhodoferax soli]RCW73816.1 hypothetical protein DES41_102130 [Pseudorhodoferax soli]
MKDRLKRAATQPLTAVLGLGVAGAGCIVAGVGLIAGTGWALAVGGAFLLAAASLIAKGMSTDV